jgi:hypothetical protein
MAIFVTEDDPQDGQDHVDAHRTIQLVLSPYAKRGHTSHVHHSNLSTLKTMDLLLGVGPNSTQEATATPLSDYFQPTRQLEPRFTTRPQQVPYAENPTAQTAQNAKLARAAELMEDVPAGIDEGGEELQEVLRLQHEGASEANLPGVPKLTGAVEHTLAAEEPDRLVLSAKPDGPCPLVANGEAVGELPATGGRNEAAVFAIVIGVALAFRRVLRRRPQRA